MFRRPVKSPKDQISDLLKSLQEEPERYGLQKEEINRIISDNTGKELQKFVDDLKLKNLISEDIQIQQAGEEKFSVAGSRARQN